MPITPRSYYNLWYLNNLTAPLWIRRVQVRTLAGQWKMADESRPFSSPRQGSAVALAKPALPVEPADSEVGTSEDSCSCRLCQAHPIDPSSAPGTQRLLRFRQVLLGIDERLGNDRRRSGSVGGLDAEHGSVFGQGNGDHGIADVLAEAR